MIFIYSKRFQTEEEDPQNKHLHQKCPNSWNVWLIRPEVVVVDVAEGVVVEVVEQVCYKYFYL